VTGAAFERGLIIETSGAHDEIVKILAPLTIEDDVFAAGLDILADCVAGAVQPQLGAAA
jgi:diaminobutyrate-2-oxoglutarate transaminase